MQTPAGFDPLKEEIAQDIATAMAPLVGRQILELTSIVASGLERPKDTTHGDYALPTFRMAKEAKTNPAEFAAKAALRLEEAKPLWLKNVATVGAFLNLKVDQAWLAARLLPAIANDSYLKAFQTGTKPRVMIEYSQPNTHKLFHVGHMRNVALGDSLWRLYDYVGYPVTPVNYIGDEGAHIAKCLWYMNHTGAKPPAAERADWLGEMYAEACILLEDAKDPEKGR